MRAAGLGLVTAGLLVFWAVPAHAQQHDGLPGRVSRTVHGILQGRTSGVCSSRNGHEWDERGDRAGRADNGPWNRRGDERACREDTRRDGRRDRGSARSEREIRARIAREHEAWHRAHPQRRTRAWARRHAELHRRLARERAALARRNGDRAHRSGDRDDRWDGGSHGHHDNGRHLGWYKQGHTHGGRGHSSAARRHDH